jgi:hypothetical protein
MTPMPTVAAANLRNTIFACVALAAVIAISALPRTALAGDVPTFSVGAAWPKPLPNNWILGQVGGITAEVDNAKRIQKFRLTSDALR